MLNVFGQPDYLALVAYSHNQVNVQLVIKINLFSANRSVHAFNGEVFCSPPLSFDYT